MTARPDVRRPARGACHGENRMRGFGSAAWPRVVIVGALGLALAGCADVDEALFGPYPATQTAQVPAKDEGDNADNAPQAAAPEATAPAGEQASTAAKAPPPAATEAEAAPPPATAQAEAAPPPAAVQTEGEAALERGGSGALPGTLPPIGGAGATTTVAAGLAVEGSS